MDKWMRDLRRELKENNSSDAPPEEEKLYSLDERTMTNIDEMFGDGPNNKKQKNGFDALDFKQNDSSSSSSSSSNNASSNTTGKKYNFDFGEKKTPPPRAFPVPPAQTPVSAPSSDPSPADNPLGSLKADMERDRLRKEREEKERREAIDRQNREEADRQRKLVLRQAERLIRALDNNSIEDAKFIEEVLSTLDPDRLQAAILYVTEVDPDF